MQLKRCPSFYPRAGTCHNGVLEQKMEVIHKNGVTVYLGELTEEVAARFDSVAQNIAAFPSANHRCQVNTEEAERITCSPLEPREETFPLHEIMSTLLLPFQGTFEIRGSISGQRIFGHGSFVRGELTPDTFENTDGLSQVSATSLNVNVEFEHLHVFASLIDWYDTRQTLLAEFDGETGEYAEFNDVRAVPVTAKIGDGGILQKAIKYRDSTRSEQLGTITISFFIKQCDGAGALLILAREERDNSGRVETRVYEEYHIEESGLKIRRIKDHVVSDNTEFALIWLQEIHRGHHLH